MTNKTKFQFVLSEEVQKEKNIVDDRVFTVTEVDSNNDLYRVSWDEGHYDYLKSCVRHFVNTGLWNVLH